MSISESKTLLVRSGLKDCWYSSSEAIPDEKAMESMKAQAIRRENARDKNARNAR